jgi:hypothetical protein
VALLRVVLVLLAVAAAAGQYLQEGYRLAVIQTLPGREARDRYERRRRRSQRVMTIVTIVFVIVGLVALVDLVLAS